VDEWVFVDTCVWASFFTMTTMRVQQIAEQIKSLPDDEREEFLVGLADYQLEHTDAWDEKATTLPIGASEAV